MSALLVVVAIYAVSLGFIAVDRALDPYLVIEGE